MAGNGVDSSGVTPRANRRTGRIEMQRCAGGHLAIVRSLRTSRQKLVADWILRSCVDAGWRSCKRPPLPCPSISLLSHSHFRKDTLCPEPTAV